MSSKKKSANKQQQKQQPKELKKQCCGGFPMKSLLFLTSLILAGLIYSDVQSNSGWKDSQTAHLLKKYHVCEYSHKVLNKTSESIKWMNSEIDKYFPGYEKKLHELLEPYGDLLGDLGVISCNIGRNIKEAFVSALACIAEKIEQLAPGLLGKTEDGIKLAASTSVEYTKKGIKFLREEVFVGKLAPENMARSFSELYSTAHRKAHEFYVWAYEKVRTVVS